MTIKDGCMSADKPALLLTTKLRDVPKECMDMMLCTLKKTDELRASIVGVLRCDDETESAKLVDVYEANARDPLASTDNLLARMRACGAPLRALLMLCIPGAVVSGMVFTCPRIHKATSQVHNVHKSPSNDPVYAKPYSQSTCVSEMANEDMVECFEALGFEACVLALRALQETLEEPACSRVYTFETMMCSARDYPEVWIGLMCWALRAGSLRVRMSWLMTAVWEGMPSRRKHILDISVAQPCMLEVVVEVLRQARPLGIHACKEEHIVFDVMGANITWATMKSRWPMALREVMLGVAGCCLVEQPTKVGQTETSLSEAPVPSAPTKQADACTSADEPEFAYDTKLCDMPGQYVDIMLCALPEEDVRVIVHRIVGLTLAHSALHTCLDAIKQSSATLRQLLLEIKSPTLRWALMVTCPRIRRLMGETHGIQALIRPYARPSSGPYEPRTKVNKMQYDDAVVCFDAIGFDTCMLVLESSLHGIGPQLEMMKRAKAHPLTWIGLVYAICAQNWNIEVVKGVSTRVHLEMRTFMRLARVSGDAYMKNILDLSTKHPWSSDIVAHAIGAGGHACASKNITVKNENGHVVAFMSYSHAKRVWPAVFRNVSIEPMVCCTVKPPVEIKQEPRESEDTQAPETAAPTEARVSDLTARTRALIFKPWTAGEIMVFRKELMAGPHPQIPLGDTADEARKELCESDIPVDALMKAMYVRAPLLVQGWETTCAELRPHIERLHLGAYILPALGPCSKTPVQPDIPMAAMSDQELYLLLNMVGPEGCAVVVDDIVYGKAHGQGRVRAGHEDYENWGGFTQQTCLGWGIAASEFLRRAWELACHCRLSVARAMKNNRLLLPLFKPWISQWVASLAHAPSALMVVGQNGRGELGWKSLEYMVKYFPHVFEDCSISAEMASRLSFSELRKHLKVEPSNDPLPVVKRTKGTSTPDSKRAMPSARQAKYYANDRMAQLDETHHWVLECALRTRVKRFVTDLQACARPCSLALLDRFVCDHEAPAHAAQLVQCLCEQETTLTMGNVFASVRALEGVQWLSAFPAFSDLVGEEI